MIPNISIIVLLFEEDDKAINQCLDSIKNFKIIIIDNSNNKEREKLLKSKYKIYEYIRNDKNLGFGKANNLGIKRCDTEYLLILNSDCIISEENIQKLYNGHIKYDKCFLTAPTFYDHNNKLALSSASYPELNLKDDTINLEGDLCCQWVLGAAMFFKTDELKKIGMFDENFFLFFEDVDLCKRINSQDRSVIQIFDSKALHVHGQHKSVKNIYKKIFIFNYNYTFSELYYLYKINKHKEKYEYLKKKRFNYFIKIFTNLLLLKPEKTVYFFSKILAFYKFNKLINKN